MNPALQALYKETLLRHSKAPLHNAPLHEPTCSATLRNRLCGDEVTVYLSINGDTIERASFVAQCCSICSASASIMTGQLQGQSTADAEAFAASFILGFKPGAELPHLEGDLAALEGVLAFPSRIRCATLPFEALLSALRENGASNSD